MAVSISCRTWKRWIFYHSLVFEVFQENSIGSSENCTCWIFRDNRIKMESIKCGWSPKIGRCVWVLFCSCKRWTLSNWASSDSFWWRRDWSAFESWLYYIETRISDRTWKRVEARLCYNTANTLDIVMRGAEEYRSIMSYVCPLGFLFRS